jgi:hypothetical protein
MQAASEGQPQCRPRRSRWGRVPSLMRTSAWASPSRPMSSRIPNGHAHSPSEARTYCRASPTASGDAPTSSTLTSGQRRKNARATMSATGLSATGRLACSPATANRLPPATLSTQAARVASRSGAFRRHGVIECAGSLVRGQRRLALGGDRYRWELHRHDITDAVRDLGRRRVLALLLVSVAH